MAKTKNPKPQAANNIFGISEQPEETTANGHGSQTAQSGRPVSGQVLPNEPSHIEIVRALSNSPSEEHRVVVGDTSYPLTELTYLEWMEYVSILGPQIEALTKDLMPLLTTVIRSYTVLKHLGEDTREQLKAIAKTGDYELMIITFESLGVSPSDYTHEDLETLVEAAQGNKPLDFLIGMASIFLKPLAGPTIGVLQTLSVSGIVIRLGEALPKLVKASLVSSLKRQKLDYTPESLLDDIYMLDGFDMFDIIYKQYQLYSDRGKIRSFFGQAFQMGQRSSGTETPSA